MGQYYIVVNVTKKQYLHPHTFDDGLKLMEFGCSSDGTMLALAALLSNGNGRGSGDLHGGHPLIGSWAGDQIVVAGDYGDDGKFLSEEEMRVWRNEHHALRKPTLFSFASNYYEDISADALAMICGDEDIAKRFKK